MTAPASGLRPHRGVRTIESSGIYEAVDADPQFLWRPSPNERRELSVYSAIRVTVALELISGELIAPSVYVDWGDGFSEDSKQVLIAGEDPGVFTVRAATNAGALRKVRFDPSSAPCQFKLSDFRIKGASGMLPAPVRLSPTRRLIRRGLRKAPMSLQHRLRAIRGFARSDRARKLRAINGLLRRIVGGVDPWTETYQHAADVARNLRSPDFAAPPLASPRRDNESAKVIAFYLPQYHPIPENNAWWGPGFTEWTNVAKAVPQFSGHLQPRHPSDLGYYDLRVPEVQQQQAKLAALFGVDAFCFHYYWFGGRRLLAGPLDAFVVDPAITLPFALSWANENWTRRWDGQESDILIGQNHSPEDDIAVFDDLARYMASPRYLKVAGKPLLLIYRPDALPDAAATVGRWRARAREIGVGEVFIACTNAFGYDAYRRSGFDALVEFPPHAISIGEITDQVELLNRSFLGRVYDYQAVVESKTSELEMREDRQYAPGVMPAWDNEARKPGAGHVFHRGSPELFARWTSVALATAKRLAAPGERLVFINAWNEWAEGAYLEPDRWHGHAYGQALRSALESSAPRITVEHPVVKASVRNGARHRGVIYLHLHYPDLIPEFVDRLGPLLSEIDLTITFSNLWTDAELERLAAAFPAAILFPIENVGRDIAPFIRLLKNTPDQHDYFLKLHAKRSPHTSDGDKWRQELLEPLCSEEGFNLARGRFDAEPGLGLLGATRSRRTLGEPGVMFNNKSAMDILSRRLQFQYNDQTPFTAGTMFWGRTCAFASLLSAPDCELNFEPEFGRIDGTLAHALERAMGAIVTAAGFSADWSL